MQLATGTVSAATSASFAIPERPTAQESRYAQHKVIRRNGTVVGFEPGKIAKVTLRNAPTGQGEITGTVVDETNKPLAGLTCVLRPRIVQTDSNGSYRFKDVAAGDTALQVVSGNSSDSVTDKWESWGEVQRVRRVN